MEERAKRDRIKAKEYIGAGAKITLIIPVISEGNNAAEYIPFEYDIMPIRLCREYAIRPTIILLGEVELSSIPEGYKRIVLTEKNTTLFISIKYGYYAAHVCHREQLNDKRRWAKLTPVDEGEYVVFITNKIPPIYVFGRAPPGSMSLGDTMPVIVDTHSKEAPPFSKQDLETSLEVDKGGSTYRVMRNGVPAYASVNRITKSATIFICDGANIIGVDVALIDQIEIGDKVCLNKDLKDALIKNPLDIDRARQLKLPNAYFLFDKMATNQDQYVIGMPDEYSDASCLLISRDRKARATSSGKYNERGFYFGSNVAPFNILGDLSKKYSGHRLDPDIYSILTSSKVPLLFISKIYWTLDVGFLLLVNSRDENDGSVHTEKCYMKYNVLSRNCYQSDPEDPDFIDMIPVNSYLFCDVGHDFVPLFTLAVHLFINFGLATKPPLLELLDKEEE